MILLFVGPAFAIPTFTAEMESHLGMPCAPTCLVCHDIASGGTGTANQPFALALEERGLVTSDAASLGAALDACHADAVDSDGDGTADIDGLLLGRDPNGGADFCSVLQPEYGCLSHAPGSRAWLALSIAGALVAIRYRHAPGLL